MTEKDKKGSFIGLIPLIGFLFLYILVGIISGRFDSMPLLVGMLIAAIISFVLPVKGRKGVTLHEKVMIFCKGAGDSGLMMMVVIFILAGAFQGIANKMHAVSAVTNLGLSVLPQNMILPGIFIIGMILSFAMGTSMGTIVALMPVAVDVAAKTGVNPALMAGVVVGGAMFGDNNSFISASAIAAVESQKVLMRDKFKLNIIAYAPAIIINCLLLAFYPIKHINLAGSFHFDITNIIPYLMVIILSLIGLNVVVVLLSGVGAGIIIGVLHGSFTLIGSMTYMQHGMAVMEDMSIISIFVGGVVEMMKYLGGIQWLINKLGQYTKNKQGAELSIGLLIILLCIATTNNTIAIIAVGPMAVTIGKKFNLSRSRVATVLSMFATNVQGLIPYAGQLLVAGAMAKISPVTIMPWVWYCYLTLIMAIIFVIFFGSKVSKADSYDQMNINEF